MACLFGWGGFFVARFYFKMLQKAPTAHPGVRIQGLQLAHNVHTLIQLEEESYLKTKITPKMKSQTSELKNEDKASRAKNCSSCNDHLRHAPKISQF